MKKKIIIDYYDMPAEKAVQCVKLVIENGLVSKSNGIKHYCWASVFNSGEVVEVRRKKNKESADSFVVYFDKK